MNIKDKILGRRISGIFNALNILLGLFCIIYYSINANRVNEFNKAVDFYLVLAIMCCGIYVFADYVIADIFNLIAVVFITLSIGKMIVLVLEIVSCFLSREKKNAMKVIVSEK